jgi:hypothetical protein
MKKLMLFASVVLFASCSASTIPETKPEDRYVIQRVDMAPEESKWYDFETLQDRVTGKCYLLAIARYTASGVSLGEVPCEQVKLKAE